MSSSNRVHCLSYCLLLSLQVLEGARCLQLQLRYLSCHGGGEDHEQAARSQTLGVQEKQQEHGNVWMDMANVADIGRRVLEVSRTERKFNRRRPRVGAPGSSLKIGASAL
ncbi:unnamed protein product [Symbiodinium natans]|uniref:Secreted protein n=1 Tax=Symbiodinium natans TaxID=878477 RepID=A0A812RU55_9DINO|nr:unnamed protein product [Symbiodinium natans]